jgi:anti-anti-sigma regulatory factor
MKLTYKPLPNDEVLRVVCEGLVSVRGRPPKSDPLHELLGPRCYKQKVVLNLERAEGVDTSGLTWLVRVAGQFAAGGGRLAVYGFSPTVRHTLEVLGMVGTIPLASSEALAIETVGKPAEPGAAENGTHRAPNRVFPSDLPPN